MDFKIHLENVLEDFDQLKFNPFQQDSATAYKSKIVQEWCRDKLPDFTRMASEIRAALDAFPRRLKATLYMY